MAGVVGLGLAAVTSWWILAVGAACLAAGWLYTGGPRPYGYAGCGEVFVFVFFGVGGHGRAAFVQTVRLARLPLVVVGPPVGVLATALLLANNLRDIGTDRVVGQADPGRSHRPPEGRAGCTWVAWCWRSVGALVVGGGGGPVAVDPGRPSAPSSVRRGW